MSSEGIFGFNLFRALEVFSAVAEIHHVTQAAEMLGITQSAASQHLKNLETALGTQLIDRRTRPPQLTNAGIVLHRRAIAILGEVERMRVDMRRINVAPLPVLRVAMLASIATTLAPDLTMLAREQFKIPEISLFAGLSSDHETLLRNRRADVAITSDAFSLLDDLVRYPILSEQFLLVTPRGYDGPINDLQELAKKLPLVHFSRESAVGLRTDQHLSRLRLDLPRALEGDRSSVVMAPVAAGLGFAILTPTLLIDGLAEGMEVNIHKFPAPAFSREIILVARGDGVDNLPAVFAAKCADTLSKMVELRLPQLPPNSFSLTVEIETYPEAR